MKAQKPTDLVVVHGQRMSVRRVTKPVLAEALNNAAKAIERQQAALTRKEHELALREKQLAEATAKTSELAHEVVALRGGHDRSNEFVSFDGSLTAYKKANNQPPTIGEMTELVSRWVTVIERFAAVNYDVVVKPIKFRGNTLNITVAHNDGVRKLSFAGSPNQPESWVFYLGLMVMNRTRWITKPVWVENNAGKKFVAYISCTLKAGQAPAAITQDPKEFVMSLRGRN